MCRDVLWWRTGERRPVAFEAVQLPIGETGLAQRFLRTLLSIPYLHLCRGLMLGRGKRLHPSELLECGWWYEADCTPQTHTHPMGTCS
jgi:hypothetical protein